MHDLVLPDQIIGSGRMNGGNTVCIQALICVHISVLLYISFRKDGIIPKQNSFYTLRKVVKAIKYAFGAESTNSIFYRFNNLA